MSMGGDMVAEICRKEEFEGVLLNVFEDDGQEYFSAEDIGTALEFKDPRRKILQLFNRNKGEFEGLSRVLNLSTRTSTGAFRPNRLTVFNAEAAMMLGFFADTPKAKAFRRWASRFLTSGIEKLKAHVLKLEAANRKLLEKGRQKALPGPEVGNKGEIKRLEKLLKETKKAANDLIDIRDQRIRKLHEELAQAQQQAKVRPLLLEGRHRRLQRHLYKMLEELGSFRAVVVELAEHLQEK
jgi:prophage antirepressor-like protein